MDPRPHQAAYEVGLHDVGEKQGSGSTEEDGPRPRYPFRWHLMIGHLQRNKVKALDKFALLHSLDSPRLADAVV